MFVGLFLNHTWTERDNKGHARTRSGGSTGGSTPERIGPHELASPKGTLTFVDA